jgi:hypothetical protein
MAREINKEQPFQDKVVGRTHLNYLSAKYTQSQIMQGLLVKS